MIVSFYWYVSLFRNTIKEEKAKKANTTKVARMLKGNLSKVLTRHEKKVQGKTKVYISFKLNGMEKEMEVRT